MMRKLQIIISMAVSLIFENPLQAMLRPISYKFEPHLFQQNENMKKITPQGALETKSSSQNHNAIISSIPDYNTPPSSRSSSPINVSVKQEQNIQSSNSTKSQAGGSSIFFSVLNDAAAKTKSPVDSPIQSVTEKKRANQSNEESIVPIGQRTISIDATKIPIDHPVWYTKLLGSIYNPMTAPMQDYVTALQKSDKFSTVAHVVPEVLSTYAVDYTHEMRFKNTPEEVAAYSYRDWIDLDKDASGLANLYQGLIFLNKLLSRPDFTMYSQFSAMTKPVEVYIDALRTEYPLVPDKILATYVTVYFTGLSSSTTPEQLVATTKALKMPYNEDNKEPEFAAEKLNDLQKMCITMKTIQKVNARYKQYLSEPSIDMSTSSTNKNSVTQKSGEGLQLGVDNLTGKATPIVTPVEQALDINRESQAPVKLSLDVTAVPKADEIRAFVQKSIPGDINRFVASIEMPKVFSDRTLISGPTMKTTSISIPESDKDIAHFAQYYKNNNKQNILDPIIVINNDIAALKAQKERTAFHSTEGLNFETLIGVAEKIAAKVSADIVATQAELLLDGTLQLPTLEYSIYSTVKKMQDCINSAQVTVTGLKNGDSIALAIGKQYVDLYTAVFLELQKVQKAVTDAERNRLKLEDIENAHKDIENQLAKLAITENQVLGQLTNRQVLEQAKNQIDLDLVEQKKADQARAQLEDEAFKTLSKNIMGSLNVDVIKKALDVLIIKLNADKNADKSIVAEVEKAKKQLNQDGSNLHNKNERDNNGIVTKLEKLVTTVSDATPDFADFLKKTDTLQVYIAVIHKLLERMEEADKQGDKEQFITDTSKFYVTKLLEESHNLEESIATINKNILACNAQMDKQDFQSALKEIKDKAGSAPTNVTDLKKFYQNVLNYLTIKNKNNMNLARMTNEAAQRATTLLNDAKKDPIIIALEELQQKITD